MLKPRSVWAEWLLLDNTSPLRSLINKSFSDYDCFLDFEFESKPNLNPSLKFKKVPKANQLLSVKELSLHNYEQIGFMLAVCTFFGMGDLHKDNMFFGLNDTGKFVFSPIDIEILFENYVLVSQSLLLKSFACEEEYCGLVHVIPHIQKSNSCVESTLAIIYGFRKTLNKLFQNSEEYYKLLNDLNANQFPSRLILKDTSTYKNIIDSNMLNIDQQNLLIEEIVQLERGEVPYFFRFPESYDIYYWNSETSYKKIKSNYFEKKLMLQMLPYEEHLKSLDKFHKQLEYSTQQLIKYLIPENKLIAKIDYRNITIVKNCNKIYTSIDGKIYIQEINENK